MKGAVVFTRTEYEPFRKIMIKEKGYEVMHPGRALVELLEELNAVAPYSHPSGGREEGLTYFRNGLRIVIWTTFVERTGTTRDGWDFGKVLILEGGRIRYYGPEIRRTEHFFERLAMWADVLKERVCNRPSCPRCKRFMSIYSGKNGQYYWHCENKSHPREAKAWDTGLSERSLKFLKDKRDRRRSYNANRLADGFPAHGIARSRQKKWTYTAR